MAAVDILGGGGASSSAQRSDLQASTLGQEEFLKILLTQLQFQDPLKPLDNQEFLAQMAQFSSLAQSSQMNDRIETLLNIQSATQSVGLIGKAVTATVDGGKLNGTVTALTFVNGSPMLEVTTGSGPVELSVSQITSVAEISPKK